MKKIFVLVSLLMTINFSVFAQENKNTEKDHGMYFGAIIGTKINDLNRHFNVDLDPQLYSFSIGAGSSWTKNNYVIGFEFLYSAASKDNDAGQIQYIGFSNTLSFGYNISKSKNWKIEPNIGVVFNSNQLIVQDKLNTTFQNLENNPLSGNIGLNIKLLGNNGLFTGLKLGYMMPLTGETNGKTLLLQMKQT